MDNQVDQELDQAVLARIESERAYHKEHYKRTNCPLPVNFDLALSTERRPHNLTWAYYDTILDHFGRDLAGKAVLVAGCGTGDTALNLARQGANVDAFDLSAEAIQICQERAAYNRIDNIAFFVSSCEKLKLPDDYYDAIVGEMILHHIDIPIAVSKFHRSLKPGGAAVFMEWKAYPILDRIRAWPFFRRRFPPGGVIGYATEFEKKLSRADFEIIRTRFPNMRLAYRYCLRGKIDYFSPALGARLEKLDYFLLRWVPLLKYFTDGVIIYLTKD